MESCGIIKLHEIFVPNMVNVSELKNVYRIDHEKDIHAISAQTKP